MINLKQNIIVIDLKSIKSAKDINDILLSNRLMSMDPNKLFLLKTKGYTKVFIDDRTFDIIAFFKKGKKDKTEKFDFSKSYIKSLTSLKSISAEMPLNLVENLTIDDILDKISSTGINSLTNSEKNFLSENSKK